MAITKLKTVRASSEDEVPGKQEVQKPETPSKPQKPAKPSEPAKPAKPSKPAEPSKASMFDEFIDTKEDPQTVEAALVTLLASYKALVPKPTQHSIAQLAGAIGVTSGDLEAVIGNGHTIDMDELDEYGTANPESFVSASKREPKKQVAYKFDPEDDGYYSGMTGPLQEEDENFLLPMSHMQDPVYQYTAKSSSVKADVAPENNRIGTDDGAPVADIGDDFEQQMLMDDGGVDHSDAVTEEKNRALNDDGLS